MEQKIVPFKVIVQTVRAKKYPLNDIWWYLYKGTNIDYS